MPSIYAPPCVAPRPGVEGGAPARGVTETEITVVAYVAADDDLSASLSGQLDSPEASADTSGKLLAMLSETYETWGRKLNVVRLKGSGSDETSARADAVKVAEEIEAFASIGGPGQESAYAEELARRGVICVGCGLALPDSALQENAPYLWGNLQTPEQYLLNLGDFIIERLLGDKAEFAGSPEIRDRGARLRRGPLRAGPTGVRRRRGVRGRGGRRPRLRAAVNLTYQLVIADLPEKARVLVGQPEGGQRHLGDLPRRPDHAHLPDQGGHRSGLLPRVDHHRHGADRHHRVRPALRPAAVGPRVRRVEPARPGAPRPERGLAAARVVLRRAARGHRHGVGDLPEPLRILMLGIHQAGPHLTPETFRDGLFAYPPTRRVPHGAADVVGRPRLCSVPPTYNARRRHAGHLVERGRWRASTSRATEGKGMMTAADGGKRYLPGEMPDTPANVFDDDGAVCHLRRDPRRRAPPSTPHPGPGG